MKRLILVLFCSLLFLSVQAQKFYENIQFLKYLLENKLTREAQTLLFDMSLDDFSSPAQIDTVNYYLGKIYFEKQALALASQHFQRSINAQSPIGIESSFYGALCHAYLGNYSLSHDFLATPFDTPLFDQLRSFELAGICLLQREIQDFDSYSENFTQDYFQFAVQQENLIGYREKISSFNSKSPFLAGLFSAIIPGTGKMYAGKIGQGIAGFITTSLFGLQAWEGYRKDGVKSVRFILFGSLFSTFYIGNIWGSVLSVKIRRDEFNESINEAILLDMHIPLRTLFE